MICVVAQSSSVFCFLIVSVLLLLYSTASAQSTEAVSFIHPPQVQNNQGCVREGDNRKNCDNETKMTMSRLRDDLEKEIVQLFEKDLPSLPINMKRANGNIEVRIKWNGDHMLTFCEAKRLPIHPIAFRDFLVNFSEEFPQVNKMARKIQDLVEHKEENLVGTKSFLKFPFPLSPRLMIHWRYLMLDRNPNEHMVILSERGNEELLQKHWTDEEKKKYVLARTFLCSYWIQPIEEAGKVVGSRLLYVFSGDTGGGIPKFVENSVGPQTAYDSIHGLINHISKQ